MRRDWKYILYLTLAFGSFVVVKLLSPKQHDWTITYSHLDKNPYGAFALGKLLPSLFENKEVIHSNQTAFEMKDDLKPKDNIFILATAFEGEKADCDVLLNHVSRGGTVFISAQYFNGHFADTLGLSTNDHFFSDQELLPQKKDSAALALANFHLDTVQRFYFRRDNVHNYFNRFDTTRTMVIATNDHLQPVTIRIKWGAGNFVLNSTPLAFTNIYLLSPPNHEFISALFSVLPPAPLRWSEYYHLGRLEAQTPLRFILSNEPLRWAYYIALLSLVAFMVFEMKRKQRIIPVIEPLANTTLDFVSTIGNLYYQSQEHKNIAEKKILFFMDRIRATYWIDVNAMDKIFVSILSAKSGRPEEVVRQLMDAVHRIQEKEKISSQELVDLNTKIEAFDKSD